MPAYSKYYSGDRVLLCGPASLALISSSPNALPSARSYWHGPPCLATRITLEIEGKTRNPKKAAEQWEIEAT